MDYSSDRGLNFFRQFKMLTSQEDSFRARILVPKVSVIIPIYNGERDLPDLINCLLEQTYPQQEIEYLLIDNNSSDRTANLLAEAEKKALERGIQIHHLSETSIQSAYAARNRGIRNASGEIIVFTDADCRPQPNWIEQLIQPFANPQIGIVAGNLVALSGKTLLEKYAEYCGMMSPQFLLEHSFCPYGQTANLAIRKQIFTSVGLFRPHLTTGGDADICWRILKETEWQLEFASEAVILHRHRSSWRELKSQWRRYGTSNRYLHELYGVDLMQELDSQQIFYRLSRWLLKELLINTIKAIAGRIDPIEPIKTPIDLFILHSRSIGQKESKLPASAREIEWL
jgi:glycosyltransferase involved in cell wall biosynthesis